LTPGAVIADALLLWGFLPVQGGGGGLRVYPAAVLQRWLVRPVPDDDLGQQIMGDECVHAAAGL